MDPRAALATALRLHRSGGTLPAIAACRLAVRDGNPVAMRLLGLLLAEAGLFEEARHWAGRATARDRSAETLAAEGRVLAAMRDWAAAATVLREALLLLPGFAAARRLLDQAEAAGSAMQAEAAKLFAAGRFREAAALFRGGCGVRPGDPVLLHALGTALHEAGQPAEAVGAYRAALAVAPARAATWHNLGSALQATGDLDGALLAYAQAYAADPASFPRIAQELAAGRAGQVWLSADALRAKLRATARGHDTGPGKLPASPGQPPRPR
jgi:tetratricopeptide (TPR) repeat protein